MALAMAIVALPAFGAALAEEPTSQAQSTAQESAKSSPPDTNRYVRPGIPEDRLNRPVPLPRPRSETAPAPQPNPR